MNPLFPATRRPRQNGATLVETMIGLTVLGFMVSVSSGFLWQSGRTFHKVSGATTRASTGRAVSGEVMYELRQAQSVLPSYTTPGGAVYTTSVSSIVFEVPGIDPNSPAYVLPNVTDRVAYYYGQGTLRVTVLPGPGSRRRARSGERLTGNLAMSSDADLVFTYQVREQRTGSGTGGVYTLQVPPKRSSRVDAFVNGVRVLPAHEAGAADETARQAVKLTPTPSSTDDVQFVYDIAKPESSDPFGEQKWAQWAPRISKVNFSLKVDASSNMKSSGDVEQILVTGGARIRNLRR